MNKKIKKPTLLKNPNDDSQGQCYAPIVNGNVNEKRKKHFSVGESHPSAWVQVPCDPGCNFKK